MLLVGVITLLRVIDVGADTWKDLDWGTGIWTDEGFYAHNARNQVLFGVVERDGFNNYNLSPVLHAVQVAVFRMFGVGLVQSRWISIVASLATCAVTFDACRRLFSIRVATFVLIMIGLESSIVLYSRLGLMESPAVLVAALALWCWSFDTSTGRFVSGFLGAAALASKTTFLIFVPALVIAVIIAAWPNVGKGLRRLMPFFLGIAAFILIYSFVWLNLHGAEVARMNTFYRTMQSQPRSVSQLLWMIRRGLIGYHFGMLQRLETRSSLYINAAMLGCFVSLRLLIADKKGRLHDVSKNTLESLCIASLWFIFGIAFILMSRYAPSRYFLVFALPAAILGGWILSEWNDVKAFVTQGKIGRIVCNLLCALFSYHISQPALQHPITRPYIELIGGIFALMVVTVGWKIKNSSVFYLLKARVIPIAIVMFLLSSLGQYAAWFITRDYQTLSAPKWLEARIPTHSVVAGDWVPNLGFSTSFTIVPVFKGLANDKQPIKTYKIDYILTGQTPYPRRMWAAVEPGVVTTTNLVATMDYHGYILGLYKVPKEQRTP